MAKFKKQFEYDSNMDEEILNLCNAMNNIPGIETTGSCCGHGAESLKIFFNVTSDRGLFFIGRCVSHRYWKYGYLWKIEIQIGDRYLQGVLPITYMLHSGPIVGKDAYMQADKLVENMEHHLNHKAFMEGFGYKIEDFDLK